MDTPKTIYYSAAFTRRMSLAVATADAAIADHGFCTTADLISGMGIVRTTAIKYLDALSELDPEKYGRIEVTGPVRRLVPMIVNETPEPEPTPDRRPPSDEESDFDDDGKLF
jgi:hypothetical protein